MERITNTDKWKDYWFLSLHPNAKLIFIFLCENCDDAGYFKLSTKFMYSQLKIKPEFIVEYTQSLSKAIVFSKERDKVWIKNFLFYQNQLPLNSGNAEHLKIKMVIEKNLEDFNDNKDMLYVINKMITINTTTLSKRTPKRFIKPEFKEFKDYGVKYAAENNLNIKESWYKSLYNYYESNGWKVGKNNMKDWEASIRKNIERENEDKSKKQVNERMDKIVEANKGAKNVNV